MLKEFKVLEKERKKQFKKLISKNKRHLKEIGQRPDVVDSKVKRLENSAELSRDYHLMDKRFKTNFDENMKKQIDVVNSYHSIQKSMGRLAGRQADIAHLYDVRNRMKRQAVEINQTRDLKDSCILRMKEEKLQAIQEKKRLALEKAEEEERIRQEEEDARAYFEATGQQMPKQRESNVNPNKSVMFLEEPYIELGSIQH